MQIRSVAAGASIDRSIGRTAVVLGICHFLPASRTCLRLRNAFIRALCLFAPRLVVCSAGPISNWVDGEGNLFPIGGISDVEGCRHRIFAGRRSSRLKMNLLIEDVHSFVL